MKLNYKWLLPALTLIWSAGCNDSGNGEGPQTGSLKVTTATVNEITAFSARGGGIIEGTDPISERGICWSETENPTKSDSYLTDVDPIEGQYALRMLELSPETTYYVRAYAVPKTGEVVYGNQVNFKTSDLRQEKESNSYIVSPEATIAIPVSRANKSDIGTQITSSDPVSAELLWMDNMDVVDKVFTHGTGESASVVVNAGNTSGNAVVAVKVGSEIKWSWHLWVTDGQISTITMPSGSRLMDRNLGATTKTISEIGAVGVQFQFGRKDPFTASATYGNPSEVLLYDLAGRNPDIATIDGPRNLAFVTANPLTFVKSQWIDWCDEDIKTWWTNEEGTKTVYDPCPDGWRVPAIGDYSGMAEEHFDTTVEGGYNFIYQDQSNFFPFSGYREVEGKMDATGGYGTMWVNSPIDGDAGTASALSPSYGEGGVLDINGAPRARALSIRCLKE